MDCRPGSPFFIIHKFYNSQNFQTISLNSYILPLLLGPGKNQWPIYIRNFRLLEKGTRVTNYTFLLEFKHLITRTEFSGTRIFQRFKSHAGEK